MQKQKNHLRAKSLIKFMFGAFSAASAVAASNPAEGEGAGAAGKPNIILIMADDFGWGDASCNNPEAGFQTPNIDRLAREGIRFANAYTPHSVCTPSRYALLTGRYAWRTWMREGVLEGYVSSLIPPRRLTLASMLKKHGYATGSFGKWHLGLDWQPVDGDPGDFHWGSQARGGNALGEISRRVDHTKPVTVGPTSLGFDTSFITPANSPQPPIFLRDDKVDGSPQRKPNGVMSDPRVKPDEVDDIYVAEAIAFIEQHQAERQGDPFFIYLPLNAPHSVTRPPQRFKGKSGINEGADKCLWVDESVGKILDALERYNLSGNTLVLFTSDNGPVRYRTLKADKPHSPAGPYRGFKTDALDGGYRVPFLASWPGHIPAGRVSDHLFCVTDVFATLAALVGHQLPEWAGEDSLNQLPALLGEDPAEAVRNSMIYQSYTGVLSVRNDRWKLILDTKGPGGDYAADPVEAGHPWMINRSKTGQLYDLVADPYETTDLYDRHPEVVKELKNLLQKQIWAGRSRP
jgi:arylsulfatase A